MSIFRCINEGTDPRKFRWVVCPLQNLLSFKSDKNPKWTIVKHQMFDRGLYVSLGLSLWPFYYVRQWFDKDVGKYRLFRIGWRYDNNWGGYIFPTAANKKIDVPMEKGY